jgi:hypothetical protein
MEMRWAHFSFSERYEKKEREKATIKRTREQTSHPETETHPQKSTTSPSCWSIIF